MALTQAEMDAQLARFLEKGGQVQQIERNKSGRVEGQSMWGAPRKKAKAAEETPTIEPEEDID